MFSSAEMNEIIHYKPPASLSRTTSSDLKAKLRRFYTNFCVKEAYVKLMGEGFLADWISKCEFRNLQVPTPSLGGSSWGDVLSAGKPLRSSVAANDGKDGLEIWLRGEEVRNVRMEMQTFEEDFIVATMIMPSDVLGEGEEFPAWQMLDVERDILAKHSTKTHSESR